MVIAITGSGGFLGRALVHKLRQDAANSVIEIEVSTGWDILDKPELEKKLREFDILIHLAALTFVPESYKRPYDFYNVNLVGTLNMLEICRTRNKPIVYMSSYMYGHPQYLPIDENHSLSAVNPYGQSKLMGEELCRAYARDFQLSVVALRLFNLYGPGQTDNFLLSKIVKQAMAGDEIKLNDHRPRRDFIFIDDVVNALIKIVAIFNSIKGFNCYNIGYGASHSIGDVIEIVRKFYPDITVSFSGEQRPDEILDTVSNIDKAKKELSWKPLVALEAGIAEMIKYNQ